MKLQLLVATTTISLACVHAATIDFEDLSPATAYSFGTMQGFYYNGSENAGSPPVAGTYETTWESGGVAFQNTYTHDSSFGGFWSQWAYSNVVDTSTQGFFNQYAAFPGGGADASGASVVNETYAISTGATNALFLEAGQRAPQSLMVTNSTYTALSLLNGDSFAKQFGGATGTDPDYLRLDILGIDGGGMSLGSVSVFLADYRFADSADDFILDTWENVDLTGLGTDVHELQFDLASSDVGSFGINTPLYFAVDQIVTIPEPSTSAFLFVAGGILLRRTRK